MLYPIGIQSFKKIRELGYVYVDKTELIYKLVKTGTCYFLSRPRRFGKSLLMSTIEAYFRGQKELFQGLAMERLEKDWTNYHVLHLDLNNGEYVSLEGLKSLINYKLSEWEKELSINEEYDGIALRFMNVIKTAYYKTGQKVVVLIDEYDKPMLESIGNTGLQDEFRTFLKPFYGTLKTCDEFLRFVMLTGVTKFGKLSIFSDLNNPDDISLQDEYSWICGISEMELIGKFDTEIREFALKKKVTLNEMYSNLQINYDGYHFSKESPGMYNPFSLFKALKYRDIGSYWFSTGTPTYLVNLLQTGNYDLSKLSNVQVTESELESIDADANTPISVIYQSGYLTIKGYDTEFQVYTLGFPNREVEEGFLKSLLPAYTNSYKTAINQINDKNYALPFAIDKRQVIKIGCNFNPKTGTLDPWIIE